MNPIRLVSFFSGIGAFERALANQRIPHQVVRFSEIDKYAIANYCAIHDVDPALNLGDISKANLIDIPPFDMLTYGFPCQDISIAGAMQGLEGSRSSLLKYALATIGMHRPKYAIAENVKNLVSKRFDADFKALLKKLDDLGYENHWAVLNAADFGIPQNRERVFIVSIRKDLCQYFEFPEAPMIPTTLLEVLEDEACIPDKFYLPDELAHPLIENFITDKAEGLFGVVKSRDELRQTDIALCIDANYYKGFDNRGQRTGLVVIGKVDIAGELDYARRVYDPMGVAPTVIAQPSKASKIMVLGRADFINGHDIIKRIYSVYGHAPTLPAHSGGNTEPKIQMYARIRRLIPLECWRLMGFSDRDFQIAKCQTSDTQLYKQAGNSIVVNVLEAIFTNLLGGIYG